MSKTQLVLNKLLTKKGMATLTGGGITSSGGLETVVQIGQKGTPLLPHVCAPTFGWGNGGA